jgi:hypothetical protein
MSSRLSEAVDSLLPVSGRWRRSLLIAALAGTVGWTCQVSAEVAGQAEADVYATLALFRARPGRFRRYVKYLLDHEGQWRARTFVAAGRR